MADAELHVLLVEDNPADARLVRELLRDAPAPGVRLTCAAGLAEAAGCLLHGRFDAILLDLDLPDAEGIQTFVRLRNCARDIPIVILSGLADEDLAMAAVREGAQDYLLKGQVDGAVLRRALRYAIGRQREDQRRRILEAALSAAANGIVITDLAGEIRWINPAFSAMTGYDVSDVIGRNPRELVKSGRHDEAFYRNLWQTILAGRVWHGEMVNRRQDGSLYTEEQSITPVRDAAGDIRHFIAIKQDVTERRALEEQFRHAQKMEAIGRLAAGVAHDFNNLITVILGFAGLIADGLAADHPIRADLGEVKTAAERAAALTRQLLTFSRQRTTDLSNLDLNDVVSKCVPMLTRLVGEGVTIRSQLSDDAPYVTADVGQIEQVIMNLAVNGRDAMPNGGLIAIGTAIVDRVEAVVDERSDAGAARYARLSVSDTGIGMSADVQRWIFDPFFTTKAEGKGTGLGLSTVRGIVTQLGGHIRVTSEVGAGTTFKVYLPVTSESPGASAGADTAPAAVPTGTETVLVAEDESSMRIYTRAILERNGYQVIEAEDVHSAQTIAAGIGQLDLLLTDIIMPGGNGVDLQKALRVGRPDLSVVYMSGYPNEALVESGVLAPDHEFLHKPFSSDVLLRAVRTALDRRAACAPNQKVS